MAIDTTELQAVDFALGAVIAAAFADLAPNGPANYVRFLSRPAKEKIFRTEHDDAKAFVGKIAADKKGAGTEKRPDLPLVGYYRKPGLTNGESTSISGNRQWWNEHYLRAYGLTTLPVALDYTVTMCAWDKPSLDKMAVAWYYFLARKMVTAFQVPVKIGGEVLSCNAFINDPKTIMLSDASMPSGEDRLYALSCAMQVNTQLLCGEEITPLTEIEVWGFTEAYIRHGGDV
jgi:hypothetical protein